MKKRIIELLVLTIWTMIATGCDESYNNDFVSEDRFSRASINEEAHDSVSTQYYWYEDHKILINKVDEKYLVMYDASDEVEVEKRLYSENLSFRKLEGEFTQRESDFAKKHKSDVELVILKTCIVQGESNRINSLLDIVSYIGPFYRVESGDEIGTRNIFFVRLKSDEDLPILEKIAYENGVEINEKLNYVDRWYELACSVNSSGNALELANRFQECGLFEYACPSFYGAIKLASINEPLYASGALWHLGNNIKGTSNIHTNYDAARGLLAKASSDVVVAIIDTGVKISHRDFDDTMLSGWDATTKTVPNQPYNYHGTAVAGFIASVPNNNLDCAGMGYGATVLPVSMDFSVRDNKVIEKMIINAFGYAVANGSKVISCSWDCNFYSTLITNSIKDALGCDCIVVFSAGNDNGQISYPANSDPGILVVGSIDKYGYRSSFSNYGSGLDIVAPGEEVCSLDWEGLTRIGNGTSFAAPQVAGLAAMILSKWPDMTPAEVKRQILFTASKVNSSKYKYTSYNGYTFDKWNQEMGYGLINAYKALQPLVLKYPLTVKLKNSASCQPAIAYRIDFWNLDWSPLREEDIVSGWETGLIYPGEEVTVVYDVLPGKKFYLTAVAENAGHKEIDLEVDFKEGGGTAEYEINGWSLPTMEWQSAKYTSKF